MNYSRERDLGIAANCLGSKYVFREPIKAIGSGGSGIVYIADQVFDEKGKVSIPRAIKFFAFRDDLAETNGIIASNSNFETEITNITQFNHQNILKVIDGSYYTIIIDGDEVRIPYTVTEYIDGKNMEDITNDNEWDQYIKTEDDAFELFLQIARGLEYLHSKMFYHCDIAPKNIFIKSDSNSNFFAIVGDLGAGITIKGKKSGKLRVIGTRDYMPDNVASKKNQLIPREEYYSFQPSWDIFALKKTITDTIPSIRLALGGEAWHLEVLNAKLKKNHESVSDLIGDIELLRPINCKVLNLDELSEASNKIRQILIPLYPAYLSFNMYEISKHSMLLRLMDVSELLEGATTYPGANHTRYEHTLGTYELMRKAILALLRNKRYAGFFDERTVVIGLISALLSSLVSFPLSYAADELFMHNKSWWANFSKRELFKYLINFKNYDGSLYEKICEKFPNYNIKVEELEYAIFGKDNNSEPNKRLELINLLLNSSVGVRVIDYLMRDSFHIGLRYSVDIDSLFSFLSVEDEKFCLRQAGVPAAEQVIMNRYWMFKRVYWSEPNRANLAILKYLFYISNSESFAEDLRENIPSINRDKIKKCMIKNATLEDKKRIEDIFRFINCKGQKRYNRILVIGNRDDVRSSELWKKMITKTYTEQDAIRCELEKVICKRFQIDEVKCRKEAPIVLLDMPFESSKKKLGEDVSVLKHDKRLTTLPEASSTINRMYDTFNDQLALVRVYLRPDIFEKNIRVTKEEMEKVAKEEIENLLLEKMEYICG